MTSEIAHCALLQEFFEKSVHRHPERIAVDDFGETITYAGLEQRANRLAYYLRFRGVVPNQRVCLILEKNVHLYAAILGVLKSGGCWVPLGTQMPAERLQRLIARIEPRVVMVSAGLLPMVRQIRSDSAHPFSILLVGSRDSDPAVDDEAFLESMGTERPDALDLQGDDLAYIIFTSGSTGEPKGVMAYHRNICHFLNHCPDFFRMPSGLRFAHFSEITFDPSLFDLFHCWATGGTLVPNNRRRHRIHPGQFVAEMRIEVLFTVPSVIHAMYRHEMIGIEALSSLKYLILTGEVVPPQLVNVWRAAYPDCKVYNFYGTTETVIISHWLRFEAELSPEERTPVGYPVPGVRVRLLDGDHEVIRGEAGESVVTGIQISPGYWRNDAENLARFVRDPLDPRLPQMFYRTGDLLRQRADGVYEYIGRVDHQVKVRGHRVEPHEVESVLLQYPGIEEVAVVAIKPPEAMETATLAAFIVGEASVQPEVLRDFVSSRLPSYMVPSRIVPLNERLPLNANGKVDRLRLLEMLP
ncbi:MAG: amino acid adenylation domain-containing protein [Magnetococcales bacterium]|nr:amino acid adenylation domain-containing protein [Magnetococcales bacterium]